MKQLSWMYWVVVAALVLVGGAALAFADADGEVNTKVKINVNGAVESFEVDDFEEGETREFDAGEHTVTVTRTGDNLSILLDGEEIGGGLLKGIGSEAMVWVSEDEAIQMHGEGSARKVMIFKGAGEGDGEFRTITVRTECDDAVEDCDEVIDIDVESIHELIAGSDAHAVHVGGHPHAVIMTEGNGPHPMIVKTRVGHGDMVHYRCGETGSVLMVKKEDALSDTYICPATGCVMEKVTEPELKVIKVIRTVETDDATD